MSNLPWSVKRIARIHLVHVFGTLLDFMINSGFFSGWKETSFTLSPVDFEETV